jgi:NAD(P)-dependent dehydrogenase (short-subunit alcohol dehydrogenase family)
MCAAWVCADNVVVMGINDGRVAIVTGAGRGIGREHALALARTGASVVVNDLGGAADGTGADATPAQSVVAEIEAMGGRAIANGDSVSSFAGAKNMIDAAVDTFGRLDILVNNAGILRDRMLANMTEEEWDAVIDVHLKGTFAPARHAAAYWREQSKAGAEVDGRIINTSSVSGIYGNIGQANYGAAKAGIAAFTVIVSRELQRIGVTCNAIAPIAITRMTENLGPNPNLSEEERAARGPQFVSPIVAWLASPESRHVTGRVFEASSGILGIAEGWRRGPYIKPGAEPFHPADLGPLVDDLLAQAATPTPMLGNPE